MGKKADHPVFDHGIISYFLLCVSTMIAISVGSIIAEVVAKLCFPSFDQDAAGGIGTTIGALFIALIFRLYFYKDGYKGILNGHKIGWAFLMMLPFLAVHYTGSFISWGQFGLSGKFVTALLTALAPGFGEEMAFRGLGVANFMRRAKDGKSIRVIFWLSSVVFGLVHITNITAGGDPFSCAVQSVYAIGVGMLFCAVYLRTGNLWPTIIAHASVDYLEFLRGDLESSGGVMTSLGVGDWVTVAACVIAAVVALILMNKKHDEEIIELWNKKWGH